MKEIILTRGKVAIVDDEDFDQLSKWSWYTHISPNPNNFYAARGTMINYKNKGHMMHRQILQLNDQNLVVDHIDGNGLNNQKSNLRICTRAQNMCNLKKRKNTSSRFKGVFWDKSRNKWSARANIEGKSLNIGRYENEIEAALAYNVTASFAHREFASLNKI